MIAKIKRMYVRHYSDSGQKTLYIEWRDNRGKSGRTECSARKARHSSHMQALLARGRREGLRLEREVW